MGERGIARMWVDSDVRLLAPSSSIWIHGWHNCKNEIFPECPNTCSGQHVVSETCLKQQHTTVHYKVLLTTLVPKSNLLL